MLDSLCHLIHQKKIKEAENSLLALIEKIFSDSQNGSKKINDYIKMYKTMHHAFNNYYLNWLKKNSNSFKKEKQEISSSKHDNYLVACASQVAEMEDLLYELGNYLTILHDEDQKKEVAYHLQCYRNNLP